MSEQHPPSVTENRGGWSPPRLVAAGLVTAIAGLIAAGVWTLLQAQYINDYCTTRAPQPTPANPEVLGGRPAYLDGPVTVVCEYDGYPTVTVTDPVPLLGALVLAAGVLAVGIAVFRWARRPPVS
jgi:hypothetical protein